MPDPEDDCLLPEYNAPARPRSVWRCARRILGLLAVFPFAMTVVYAFVPAVSTLMIANWITLKPVDRQWRSIESISPHVIRAVIASEDSRFCTHYGVDWREIRRVLKSPDGPSRGASTLTMQTAKNLFLWHDFPLLRKPLEIVLAHWLELILPKKRILEIYLNIAEWGPEGVFGIEAGARRAFRRSAEKLNIRQSSLMAAALPNPRVRTPAKPQAFLSKIAMRLQKRIPATNTTCITGK